MSTDKVIRKFEIQKCSQILCAHKTGFLMLGHKYTKIKKISLKLSHCLSPNADY